MGKYDLAINLVKRTSTYIKTCGAERILQTKPPVGKINIEGLKYTPLTHDVCKFSYDRTLCPKFLVSLRNIGKCDKETVNYIQKEMLKRMGYKSSLSVEYDLYNRLSPNSAGAIDIFHAMFLLPKNFEKSNIPCEQMIALIRHEVDHIDKYAKTIKAEGLEEVLKAMGKTRIPENSKKVWMRLAEEANIEGFDSKKYLEAIREYGIQSKLGKCRNMKERCLVMNMYCTNPLEEAAFKAEKQMSEYYKIDKPTTYDIYGERFTKIRKLLIKHAINTEKVSSKEFSWEHTFDDLYSYAKVLLNKDGAQVLKNKDFEKIKDLTRYYPTKKEECAVMDKVYDWLKAENFNLDEIIKDLV